MTRAYQFENAITSIMFFFTLKKHGIDWCDAFYASYIFAVMISRLGRSNAKEDGAKSE